MSAEWKSICDSWSLRPLGKKFVSQPYPLEFPDSMPIRSEEEVFQRIMALFLTVGFAYTESGFFPAYVEKLEIMDWLSPSERKFLFEVPTEHQMVQKSWQSEALFFLTWAAGLHDRISIPKSQCRLGKILDLFPDDLVEATEVKSKIRLRPANELQAWATLVYRMESMSRKGELPSKFNPGVVREWFRAAKWLFQVQDESDGWDDVDLST